MDLSTMPVLTVEAFRRHLSRTTLDTVVSGVKPVVEEFARQRIGEAEVDEESDLLIFAH